MKRVNKYTIAILTLVLMALLFTVVITNKPGSRKMILSRNLVTEKGVCPPFYLFAVDGDTINPVTGKNLDQPYSPKQTCGKCHDYDKITEGFHFQQGKDEKASGTYAERYQWASNPGNYGGNWCSPAPLYNYLSKKENSSAVEMDMTSFTFITSGCGACHPGSGSLEYDRKGFRYDKYMDSLGYTAGGINNYDGDYYKAYWNRSGVGEGDCMLCHLPEYDYKTRNNNLLAWNFKWMATAGSGLAKVDGSVKDSTEVKLSYDLSKFDKDGKVSMHLVREPRNETCLNCHSKPMWKKRGASFTAFTDVHIAKGLKCVDCHSSGSMAADNRIYGKEIHQIGKGDDPSGFVRNDLDNTMRTCNDCHLTGYLNAPIANHEWLPSFHLEKISCQACHIPERKVKSALVQASDVFNPGTKISPPPKYIWTFYDQEMNYWNHYGELSQFTAKDQPNDRFIPQYAKYKGRIFPVNPVHSSWPAIYTKGSKGLHQPKMKDVYDMWMAYKKDKSKYMELSKIKDDNNDSIPEVNNPEEIEAIINSVSKMLLDKGYDLNNRQVVWVNNDRMYLGGKEYETMESEAFESSPYASVYKFSHDVFPANAALGSKGCTECHSMSSDNIFNRQIVKYPFGGDGSPVYEPQYIRLGMSGFMVLLSGLREQYLKTAEYASVLFLLIMIAFTIIINLNNKSGFMPLAFNYIAVIYIFMAAGLTFIYLKPDLNSYILPERVWLDKNHFILSMIPFLTGIFLLLLEKKSCKEWSVLSKILIVVIVVTAVSGFFMVIKYEAIETIVKIAYTAFDASVIVIAMLSIIHLIIIHHRTLAKGSVIKAQS